MGADHVSQNRHGDTIGAPGNAVDPEVAAKLQWTEPPIPARNTGVPPKKYGSEVTGSYNSAKPSDSTLNPDPVAGKKRVGNLVTGSGIALVLCVVPLVAEKIRKPEKHK